MPAGVMNAPRLAPPTALPRSLKNANSTTGLSLGLNQDDDGWQREASQTADRELLKIKGKDDDYESRSGSENLEGGSCEEQDGEPPRKKRYHRHTPRQIQEMEMLFKECPHPDDKQRQMLSQELALSPRQVKFWFQNRRTQLKAQQERSDNSVLRMENDNLRAENVVMHEALKKISCPNCGGPATVGEITCDEQQLRVENARLKDELDRVSVIAAKYLGRTIPSYSAYQPQIPSLLLDLPTSTNPIGTLMPRAFGQERSLADLASRPGTFSDAEKPLVVELAVAAMDELLHMCQPEETSWMPSIDGAKEILNYEEYIRQYFGALGERPFGLKTEATRETGLVMMNGVNLVEIIMDSAKWMEIFPSIISRACTLDVLSTGVTGNRNGALQLMYSELQVLSPLVPTREFYFLRYCKQHVEGMWAVVDVSIDVLRDNPSPLVHCRRRPSGYLIQDMPNGYAKVTVLDHVEYDNRSVNHMYSALVSSGRAFGAQRWLATLQCQCERLASLLATNISSRVLGVIPTANGRRSMLKLAQRMTNNFCAGVSASTIHTWTTLSGTGENDVRVMTRKSENNPGEPYGIVLSAATSLWLPVTPQRVFEFLRDERLRNEWDILSNGGIVQEMAHIAKGHDPGNSVSLLKVNALNSSTCNMLILQESSIDVSGSLVVYAPVDIPAMNIVMQGGDPGCVSLLPSGFAILPDGPERLTLQSESEVDIPRTGGSLLTVAFQILVSNTPSAKLSLESVTTVNNLITCTVQKIKATLNCEHI